MSKFKITCTLESKLIIVDREAEEIYEALAELESGKPPTWLKRMIFKGIDFSCTEVDKVSSQEELNSYEELNFDLD